MRLGCSRFKFSLSSRLLVLYCILFFTLVKGLLWAFVIPPLETPDEPAHFAYVQYVAEQHRVPIVGTTQNGFSPELSEYEYAVRLGSISFHSKTLYTLDRPKWKKVLLTTGKDSFRLSGGSTSAAGYPPMYYWVGSLFYQVFHASPIDLRLYAVRFLSVLMGVATIWAAFRIGVLVWPESTMFPAVLAVVSSLQPMFSMVSASVNNDNAVILMASLLLLWILTLMRRYHVSVWFLGLGGVLSGLALLTKAESIFIVFATIMGIILVSLRQPKPLPSVFRGLMWVVIPAIVIFSPWAIFSLQHYGSILGTMGFQARFPGSGSLSSYIELSFLEPGSLMRQFQVFVITYWADFGWLDTTFSSMILYKALFGITILGLIGTTLAIFRGKKGKWICFPDRLTLTYLVGYLIGNVAFLYAVEYQYFHIYHTTMLQGRYLLTSLIPLSAILIVGVYSIVPRRFHSIAGVVLVIGAVALNIASLSLQLQRFYWG